MTAAESGSGSPVGVRLARTSDVDDIASVQIASWRERFADVLPSHVLAALVVADLAAVWSHAVLHPPTPRHRVLVAVEADRAVGYATAGPADDPDAGAATWEMGGLDVAPAAQRRGHGSRLLAAVADHARQLGADEIVVWGAIADEARRSFLSSAGWAPDGAYRDLLVAVAADGTDVVLREARMVTALTAP